MGFQYNIDLQIQSASSNCVQTSVSQFLAFYGIHISPADIEKAVPVRVSSDGKPMGTLYADIGTWLKVNYNLSVTMHVFDTQIIDRSWRSASREELLQHMLLLQKQGVSSARTPYAPLLVNAYIAYLQSGCDLSIVQCTNALLQHLLNAGPVLAIVNFNYLYDYPRVKYNSSSQQYVPSAAGGKVVEHSIVLTGYDEGVYYYNDPDSEKGGKHTVSGDVLIGAICAAQLNSDNYLLTIESRNLK